MEKQKWEFWIRIMSVAREYLSLDKLPKEAEDHRNSAEKLFREEHIILSTDTILERFSELEDLNKVEITAEIMDNLKECIYDYVSNKFISAIVLGGLITERIADNLLEEKSKISSTTSSKLSQSCKINILGDEEIIDPKISGKLHQIRKIRNKYVHPKQNNLNTEKDALLILTKIIDVVYTIYAKPVEES